MQMKFKLKNTNNKARRGTMIFARGMVETPAFMPVGTYGTVKAMTPEEVKGIGAQIILGNTFHLSITPGTEVIKAHGDLHDFMHWQGPILTDSGGSLDMGCIHQKSSQYLHLSRTEFLLILLAP
jgi:queuine tRNA-ribosyltransferase